MPRFNHLQKGQLSFRLERPTYNTADGIVVHFLSFESLLARKGDGFGDSLVTHPVADPVGVAGPLSVHPRLTNILMHFEVRFQSEN